MTRHWHLTVCVCVLFRTVELLEVLWAPIKCGRWVLTNLPITVSINFYYDIVHYIQISSEAESYNLQTCSSCTTCPSSPLPSTCAPVEWSSRIGFQRQDSLTHWTLNPMIITLYCSLSLFLLFPTIPAFIFGVFSILQLNSYIHTHTHTHIYIYMCISLIRDRGCAHCKILYKYCIFH